MNKISGFFALARFPNSTNFLSAVITTSSLVVKNGKQSYRCNFAYNGLEGQFTIYGFKKQITQPQRFVKST
jgi:hypothetical protein